MELIDNKLLKALNMTLIDYFAIHAPEPSREEINIEKLYDKNKAHHDDKFVCRDDRQIKCYLRYKFAKEMMKVR